MYRLKFSHMGIPHDAEAETIEEILSMAVDVWNMNGSFDSVVDESGKMILAACEIYQKIGKTYY